MNTVPLGMPGACPTLRVCAEGDNACLCSDGVALFPVVDLIAQAKSGTGKTCVFAVLALESLVMPSADGLPQVLILAPTRELATQIGRTITVIGEPMGARCTTLIGGISMREDRRSLLAGCDVAVATPGRFISLLQTEVPAR